MMTGLRLNWAPLKEPLGFIKVLEWLMAVLAFGCCAGYVGRNVASIFCGGGRNETLNVTFSYPFRLNQVLLVETNGTLCNHTVPQTHLVQDVSSSAEFFVAVGVLAFLYCLLALLAYVGYMHIYRDSDLCPIADFLMTVFFAFFWMVSSSAWARGLQLVKEATGTEAVRAILPLCHELGVTCEVTDYASMRSLNISVVVGYLNMMVWAGNAWFAYKETRWSTQKASSQPGGRAQAPAPI
ncbi:synaptophysin-like protein 1 isoform X1 [Paramormyrops kingsleyae]|uniref:Synaptophysin like 1 n=1 Tax=Paramormyrops kingsleyae TaxID=1676925 RepID=A0A3B3T6Q9_9TELE|nr:synaptophysin-like protein 1 isoform X1 [Paramormyrops kingsleyae]XP_023694093.1 synaptophysin-like protein 1 isoform X1 [Paramormyrops kingsleyae]XP_023694102.1 synaptophysin-like protein 1 isoform X1 [Paramormyrops kingsleyae]